MVGILLGDELSTKPVPRRCAGARLYTSGSGKGQRERAGSGRSGRAEPFAGACYEISVVRPGSLPPVRGMEIAMAGRSNAGKSTLINALCGQRGLARVSRTPGRTRCINFFRLPSGAALVDLPGYGYASGPAAERAGWQALVGAYLDRRAGLAGVLLVMDARHPLTPLDALLIRQLRRAGCAMLAVLNKADQLPRGRMLQTERTVRAALGDIPVCSVSARTGFGIAELKLELARWLNPDEPSHDPAAAAEVR